MNRKTNLHALRRLTAALAIIPGFEIGKFYMSMITPGTGSHLAMQIAGTLALGYATAYFLIGIVAAQFLEPKPKSKQ